MEPTRVVSILPAGTAFSRYLIAKGFGDGDSMLSIEVAEQQMRTTPQVAACLKAELSFHQKAAVAPGTTSDSVWANPITQYGIASEALALERGLSIIGALSGKMRNVPFRLKVPVETGAGAVAAWVGENLSTPAAATAYAIVSQEVYKAGLIVPLSKELVLVGDPSAERTVRETVTASVVAFLDNQFLLPTVTASANLRPASITNGATAVTSTGSTAAQITADLNSLLNAITTSGGSLVWIMRPMTAYRIAATLGGSTAGDIPRTLLGIPLILSINSPQQVTLVDASQILYSDGGLDIDVSQNATIQFNDAPTDPAVAATVYRSLYQENLIGIRVTRWIAYQRARSGSVAYMTVTY